MPWILRLPARHPTRDGCPDCSDLRGRAAEWRERRVHLERADTTRVRRHDRARGGARSTSVADRVVHRATSARRSSRSTPRSPCCALAREAVPDALLRPGRPRGAAVPPAVAAGAWALASYLHVPQAAPAHGARAAPPGDGARHAAVDRDAPRRPLGRAPRRRLPRPVLRGLATRTAGRGRAGRRLRGRRP